jgi:hypothetical protein
MFDTIRLYTITFGAIFVGLLLVWIIRSALRFPRVLLSLLRIAYPVWIRRRKWRTSVTYLEVVLLLLYLIVNGICIRVVAYKASDAMRRLGIMASINMILLFLGGRTNKLADKFGVPLYTYYLLYYWVGRMVVIQGVLYAGLAISLSRNSLNKSGILVSLLVLFVKSLI